MSDLRYMYLDLNSFFASCEQQANPELRGKPVAVIPTDTEATCAIAASYEAKAFGVKTGTMIYDAKRMCPGLICIKGDHQLYRDYHEAIITAIDRHIPVWQVESIDEFSFQLQGRQCTDEGARELAYAVKQGMAEDPNVGPFLRCSIGFSTNRFLAKTATNLQKPDGLQILRHDELVARTRDWNMDKLTGIGRNMYKRLLLAGIGDIETLYNLSPKQLRRIWKSVSGERFWYKLHGVELPELETKRGSIGHSHILEPEWRPPYMAWQVAERLTLKAASRLRRLGYYAEEMHLSVRLQNGPRYGTHTHFPAARDTVAISRALKKMWSELVPYIGSCPVLKVAVTLTKLTHEDHLQFDLFEESPAHPVRKEREQLSNAMDRINARFGRDSVVMGFLPKKSQGFSGTKIAFTRIPDKEEFYE